MKALKTITELRAGDIILPSKKSPGSWCVYSDPESCNQYFFPDDTPVLVLSNSAMVSAKFGGLNVRVFGDGKVGWLYCAEHLISVSRYVVL